MTVANQALQREIHPIPTVQDIVQETCAACHFSKLYLRSGYHQLEFDAALREITTITTPFELRKHKRLTLGVASASKHYQLTLE